MIAIQIFMSSGGAVLEDGDGIDLVQQYNPRTNQWVEMARMLIARSGSAACVLNGLIYVVGKRDIVLLHVISMSPTFICCRKIYMVLQPCKCDCFQNNATGTKYSNYIFILTNSCIHVGFKIHIHPLLKANVGDIQPTSTQLPCRWMACINGEHEQGGEV